MTAISAAMLGVIIIGVAFVALLVLNVVLRGPRYLVFDNLFEECVKSTYTYRGATRWAKRNFGFQSRWYVRYER